MSLLHDFSLVRAAEHPLQNYRAFLGVPGTVQVHDNLLSYLWDTLQWIPTFNPPSLKTFAGLDRWGVTVIGHEGAAVSAAIFATWSNLFALGPDQLTLRGNWQFPENDDDAGDGQYARLHFDRAATVDALRRLSSLLDEVARSNAELYVLHIGI